MAYCYSPCGVGEHLYLKEELSDVLIIVNQDGILWRFPCHKLVLSSQSAVFQRMLDSDFTERATKEIIIRDMNPNTVERLLRYIYCGKVELENWNVAISLLQASHKYHMDTLVQKCGSFLKRVITLSNVCHIYNEASLYSLGTLKEKCLKLMLDAGFIVLRSKSFEILSKDAVMDVVNNSCLNIDSELTVFDALLRWAPMQCCRTSKPVTEENILAELQPFLQYVCFDDMSDADKSALPPSILSCVKPQNRNRMRFSISELLLAHMSELKFRINYLQSMHVSDRLTCMRFTIDSPLYLLGIDFVFLATHIPTNFELYIINEVHNLGNQGTIISFGAGNFKEGLRVNESKQFEGQVYLTQPLKLEEKMVHVIACVGPDTHEQIHCPMAGNLDVPLLTRTGPVNFTLHCDSVWSVRSLMCIS